MSPGGWRRPPLAVARFPPIYAKIIAKHTILAFYLAPPI